MPIPEPVEHTLTLARTALERPRAPFQSLPERLILVDVGRQELALLVGGLVEARYAVSTALAGVGGVEGSHCTPPGWHRIHQKIGAEAPVGALFVSREATGAVWRGEKTDDDLILTRVLTLEGLEEGVNRGAGRDSLERYIYIHGTNHPERIGRAVSHGCVRMRNDDIVELFERVREGDPVTIVEAPLA
jgi:hypothetical protein